MGEEGEARRWPWVAGAGGALVVLGPFLRAGALLGLDLAVLPSLRVSDGVFGLGPSLPRRGLWLVGASLLSHVLGGPRAVTLLLGLAMTLGFVGVTRLARGAPAVAQAGAGVLYAFGPFVMTRIGVGHLSLVIAMGVLPWALPALLQPAVDLRRTFRWGLALAIAGPFGGGLALATVAVGVLYETSRRIAAVAIAVASQAVWWVPLVVVSLAQRPGVGADSTQFVTDAGGVLGLPRLLAGDGFWARTEQVGLHDALLTALAGVALLGLAVLGHRAFPASIRRPLATLAVVGLVGAAASELPGLAWGAGWLTRVPPFTALREGQRLLPLTLVWLAPAVALGAARAATGAAPAVASARRVLPLALALVLAGPGFWGAGGRLAAVDVPAEWTAARAAVAGEPGTVLALPWHEHVSLSVAGGRRVLDPLPDLFPGDILASTALEAGAGSYEDVDARQTAMDAVLTTNAALSPQLPGFGVRWVALLPGVDPSVDAQLAADTGLEVRVDGPALRLYRVRSWVGAVVDDRADAVASSVLAPPLARVDASGPATWHRSGGWGWMRGWHAGHQDANGELTLPAGKGLVWYWPAIVVFAVYSGTAAALLFWRQRVYFNGSSVRSLSVSPT
jgi:hypothetical protein